MFCAQCGKEVAEGHAFCPACGSRISGLDAAGAPAPVGGRSRTAWEDRERTGSISALLATLKGSLFSPSDFFRSMNVTGGLSDPLLYAMIVGVVGIMVSYVWQVLFQASFLGYLPSEMQGTMGIGSLGNIGLAFVALFIPFFVICSLFLWAGMLHLLLLMVRGANNGFEATFRAVAYSYSTYLFMTVPFCGGLIASIWSLIIAIIGLKEAHGTTGGKASFAVLFPLILCCALVFLVALLVFGTVAASFGTVKPSPWK
jgi:hypothetical protein